MRSYNIELGPVVKSTATSQFSGYITVSEFSFMLVGDAMREVLCNHI